MLPRMLPVCSPAELIKALFKVALCCDQLDSEELPHCGVQRPQFINGHRVKVISIHATRVLADYPEMRD